jgi:hypothetical protein
MNIFFDKPVLIYTKIRAHLDLLHEQTSCCGRTFVTFWGDHTYSCLSVTGFKIVWLNFEYNFKSYWVSTIEFWVQFQVILNEYDWILSTISSHTEWGPHGTLGCWNLFQLSSPWKKKETWYVIMWPCQCIGLSWKAKKNVNRSVFLLFVVFFI